MGGDEGLRPITVDELLSSMEAAIEEDRQSTAADQSANAKLTIAMGLEDPNPSPSSQELKQAFKRGPVTPRRAAYAEGMGPATGTFKLQRDWEPGR